MLANGDKQSGYTHVEAELLEGYSDLKNLKKAEDYFSKIRKQITAWAEKKGGHRGKFAAEVLLFAPDLFMLLVRLAQDQRIAIKNKALVLAGIAYFILPIDFLPEAVLGPLGLTDDVLMAVSILNLLLNTDRQVVLEHWSGNTDLIYLLQEVISKADQLVNDKVYKRIIHFIDRKK